MTANQDIVGQALSQSEISRHTHPNPFYRGFYKKGCRCDFCKAANREVSRRWRVKNGDKHKEMCKEWYRNNVANNPEAKREKWRKHIESPGMREKSRARGREYGKLPKEQLRKRRLTAKRNLERREILSKIRIERGCIDCGYKVNAIALEFDHVKEGKTNGVTRLTCHSMEKILAEIELCEIRCRNCHRHRTRIQLNQKLESVEFQYKDNKCAIKAREKAKRNRQILADIKTSKGCVDCGFKKYPEALDFDHIRGEKKFNLSASHSRSTKLVLEELGKVEVRCANCHIIRTWERNQAKKAALDVKLQQSESGQNPRGH